MRRAVVLALGAYVCLMGAVVHRHVLHAGGVTWPWGLVLVVLVTFAVAAGADVVTRLGAAWFALGWSAVLIVLQMSPGGSYLVASDWIGWAFTLGCVGVIVLQVVRPPRLRP